jgi:imidazoleglycerol phosphate synthase cyclase subunit
VGINTAAVKNPDFVKEASETFGKERITVAVDARRNSEIKPGVNVFDMEDGSKAWFELVIYGGRTPVGIDVIDWCRKMEDFGAGEILPTSMDRDGTNIGYDLPLTKAICEAIDIPVIASGGAATPHHILEAFIVAKADAALAEMIFFSLRFFRQIDPGEKKGDFCFGRRLNERRPEEIDIIKNTIIYLKVRIRILHEYEGYAAWHRFRYPSAQSLPSGGFA